MPRRGRRLRPQRHPAAVVVVVVRVARTHSSTCKTEELSNTHTGWDPEVQAIMNDVEFQPVLQACQQPGHFMRFMRDPRYAPRLQLLIDRGVFQMHS